MNWIRLPFTSFRGVPGLPRHVGTALPPSVEKLTVTTFSDQRAYSVVSPGRKKWGSSPRAAVVKSGSVYQPWKIQSGCSPATLLSVASEGR